MIVIIVAIDQITKYFAKACLYGKGAKPFIKGVVEFVYAQNTGVAFSMFDGGRWFFAPCPYTYIICKTEEQQRSVLQKTNVPRQT